MATSFGPNSRAYCVGGGIASLSAAFFLIRDARIPPANITILEELSINGGCLDASGDPSIGYVSRGGRMFEEHYVCMYDMLKDVPFASTSALSSRDDIFFFNQDVVSDARCRLVDSGRQKLDDSSYGLSWRHLLAMTRLLLFAKGKTQKKISDYFPDSFFSTVFWRLWTTSFSFQEWSNADELRRYFLRFIQLLPGFNQFLGIQRTRYNQYDALIEPLQNYLRERGVVFQQSTTVEDLSFTGEKGLSVNGIRVRRNGSTETIPVSESDAVFVTLGSMVESSTRGSMRQAAPAPSLPGPSWTLWKSISQSVRRAGTPDVFIENVAETEWVSFTVTQSDPAFFQLIERMTDNKPGTGGLISFVESGWFLSIVLFHQPFYAGQPEDRYVFWGYGLKPHGMGDLIKKRMVDCNGEEILLELLHHLKFDETEGILSYSNCIPTRMPYITSQFQPRPDNARPQPVSSACSNLAFTGQYVELKDDVVFTVEYSVRSAMTAVYNLFDVKKRIPHVYKGQYHPVVLWNALKALLR